MSIITAQLRDMDYDDWLSCPKYEIASPGAPEQRIDNPDNQEYDDDNDE